MKEKVKLGVFMDLKNIFRKSIILFFMVFVAGFAAAQPVVTAHIDSEVYAAGDSKIVEVAGDRVTVEIEIADNNDGFQGIFFDLAYDDAILEVESVEPGFLVNRENLEHKFLYAVADSVSSVSRGGHIIMSYALTDKTEYTTEYGTLARVTFRVLDTAIDSSDPHFISFKDGEIRDETNTKINGVQWNNSLAYYISTPQTTGHVSIEQPFSHEVFYGDAVTVQADVSFAPGRYVVFSNDETGFSSDSAPIPVPDAEHGQPSMLVPLVAGKNRISVTLYDSLDNQLNDDYIEVFRRDHSRYIEITSPGDHALLNNNYLNVLIDSKYDNVLVNGRQVSFLQSSAADQSNKFSANIMLSTGFNEIKAQTTGPEGEVYQHIINVYYDQGKEVFRILTPLENDNIHLDPETQIGNEPELKVLGELSRRYYIDEVEKVENVINIDIIFHPLNTFLRSQGLVNGADAVIRAAASSDIGASAPYVFELPEPVKLGQLGTGKIEITAYKNRGTSNEQIITRFISVSSSKLELILNQPNVFSSDLLNSTEKFSALTNGTTLTQTEITPTGTIRLTSNVLNISEISPFTGTAETPLVIRKVILSDDGIRYALGNDKDNNTLLFRKTIESIDWEQIDNDDFLDFYAYDMEIIDGQILFGVSNKFFNGETGLRIYDIDTNTIENIILEGQSLTHVQFIETRNDKVYLYGNNYTDLLEFSIHSLEIFDNKKMIRNYRRIPFNTSFFINNLIFSKDMTSAMLEENGTVHFYQLNGGNGFSETVLNTDSIQNSDYPENETISRIVYNENEGGSYQTYLFINESGTKIYSLMENKNNSRHTLRLLDEGINILLGDFDLKAIGSDGNDLVFAYKDLSGKVRIKYGRALFNEFFPDITRTRDFANTQNKILDFYDFNIIALSDSSVYSGIGDDIASGESVKCVLRDTFSSTGYTQFSYVNNGAEAYSGFSFEVDKKWFKNNGLQFSFNAFDGSSSEPIFTSQPAGLDNFGSAESLESTIFSSSGDLFYTVEQEYISERKSYIISVDFESPLFHFDTENEKFARLDFGFGFISNTETTPEFRNLEIRRKNIISIPYDNDLKPSIVILPISGRISDPFVEKLEINSIIITDRIKPDGSFQYNYEIPINIIENSITISAQSSLNTNVSESFNVKTISSITAIDVSAIKDGSDNVLSPDLIDNPDKYSLNSEYLKFEGTYFGLVNAVVGYKLYTNSDSVVNDDPAVNSMLKTDFAAGLYPEYAGLGSGYESGTFSADIIRLLPGVQYIRVYIQNPGGKKSYVKWNDSNSDLLTVDYKLPPEEQKISFSEDMDDEVLSEPENIDGIDYYRIRTVDVFENEIWNAGPNKNEYKFSKRIIISGELKSLFDLPEIIVKSDQPYVLFEDKNGVMTQNGFVTINMDNTFQIEVEITLPEDTSYSEYSDKVYLSCTPGTPFLDGMKRGIILDLNKRYANAYIVPEFDLMQNWTDDEFLTTGRPLQLTFLENRFIPEGMTIDFKLNYGDGNIDTSEGQTTKVPLKGKLVETFPGSNIYGVQAEGSEIILENLKFGINRLSWTVEYDNDIVSSSAARRAGMEDGIINITNNVTPDPVRAAFNPPLILDKYYSDTDISKLEINKDQSTELTITLNGSLIPLNQFLTIYSLDLSGSDSIQQGMNNINVQWKNKLKEEGIYQFTFRYDNKGPVIYNPSLNYNEQFDAVNHLKVLVREKNIASIHVIHGLSQSSHPSIPKITQIEDDLFIAEYDFTGTGMPVLTWNPENIKIRVIDHAGNITTKIIDSNPVSSLNRPEVAEISNIILGNDYINISDTIAFEFEKTMGDGSSHTKFFNDDVIYADVELANDDYNYEITRPGTVFLGSEDPEDLSKGFIIGDGDKSSGTKQSKLTVSAGKSVVLGPGFKVKAGAELSININEVLQELNSLPQEFEREIKNLSEVPDMFTVQFQFRFEQYAEQNYVRPDTENYVRILTFYDEGGYSLFVGYKIQEDTSNNPTDPLIAFVFKTPLDEYKILGLSTIPAYDPNSSVPVPFEWTWINAGIDRSANQFYLHVEGNNPQSIIYTEVGGAIISTIFDFSEDNDHNPIYPKYYFGDTSDNIQHTVHYSIRDPFLLHATPTIEEANATRFNNTGGNDKEKFGRIYDFNDVETDIIYQEKVSNSGYNKIDADYDYRDLRIYPPESEDFDSETNTPAFFKETEEYSYSVETEHGSLKASSKHDNHINYTDKGLKIRDASHPVVIGASEVVARKDAEGEVVSIEFEPGESQKPAPAYYYFSNDSSLHSLSTLGSYSISGTINDVLDADGELIDLDAQLVVKMSGHQVTDTETIVKHEEQRFPLTSGPFHFVIPNSMDTLTDFNIIIETKSKININVDMQLNEGNFVIPEDYKGEISENYATTQFTFGSNSTIRFFYKPLNHNKKGFVNEPVILFDSNYVSIYSYIDSADGIAKFGAAIKGHANSLKSDFPVRQGWQEVMLSYSRQSDSPDGTNSSAAYLYVDGKIAAMDEGVILPAPPEAPTADNVSIGRGLGNSPLYAEGYIDNLELKSLYEKPNFIYTDPVSYTYSEQFLELPSGTITAVRNEKMGSALIENIVYTLHDLQNNIKAVHSADSPNDFGFTWKGVEYSTSAEFIGALDPGNYLLKADMTINGHNYNTLFSFTKNYRPRFTVSGYTPIIIENEKSNIDVKVKYNDIYLHTETEQKHPGFIVKISGSTNPVAPVLFEEYKYIRRHNDGTWQIWDSVSSVWLSFQVSGDSFLINFLDIKSDTAISGKLKTFYYQSEFDPNQDFADTIIEESSFEIPLASFTVVPVAINSDAAEKDREYYKLEVTVGASSNNDFSDSIFNDMEIGYLTTPIPDKDGYTNNSPKTDTIAIPSNGRKYLYFDDILTGYGDYKIEVYLKYKGLTKSNEEISNISWKDPNGNVSISQATLDIADFSVIDINYEENTISAYLQLYIKDLEFVDYDIVAIDNETKEVGIPKSGTLTGGVNNTIVSGISIFEGINIVKVSVKSSDGRTVRADFQVNNETSAPQLYLTKAPDSLIAYNNVAFSWRGEGSENQGLIEYRYQIDGKTGQEWSTWSSKFTNVEYFSLEDGVHIFLVQARQFGKISITQKSMFLVDISLPVINRSKIHIIEKKDANGLVSAIDIIGDPGALDDVSLYYFTVDQNYVPIEEDGSFLVYDILVNRDGDQNFELVLSDRVRNKTVETIGIENKVTTLKFPDEEKESFDLIKFAPLVLVGSIEESITEQVEIFLRNPDNADSHDPSTWLKAKINEDRTFFIEDVYVTPGTSERSVLTRLEMITRLKSGIEYKRDINLNAMELYRPIDLNLNIHTAAGQNVATEVVITASAKMHLYSANADPDPIASWSIDFNGDGIYDLVEIVDQAAMFNNTADTRTWTHKYSTLGEVKPRVRVITRSGLYFSVTDELIIHEAVKQASHKLVNEPIAMSITAMDDGSDRIFILAGNPGSFRVEVYEIGRNETYISNRLFSIDLEKLIEMPENIIALDDEHLYIVSNRGSTGHVYLLQADKWGNYILNTEGSFTFEGTVDHPGRIMDITYTKLGHRLVVTFEDNNELGWIDVIDNVALGNSPQKASIAIKYENPIGFSAALAGDGAGMLVADQENERILRLNEGLNIAIDKFGSYGTGEGQFINPDKIISKENRIFVYDNARQDIQVFDPFFRTQCILKYDASLTENYLSPTSLTDVADIGAISKGQGSDLYYYALVLSKADNNIAMLRLPRYQGLSARVRSNKIVFLKDKEVFTAKPDGSDLAQILSTDAIPRIEGKIDYPNLSPDGSTMVFTSRVELYGAENNNNGILTPYTYDNLYTIDISVDTYNGLGASNLQRINLGVSMKDYEIERPVFNSNGDLIAFSAKKSGGNWQIYIYNRNEGSIRQLFVSDENARFPYFSPDDKFIVFTTDYDGDEEVEIINTENPNMRIELTSNNVRDSFPVWTTVYSGEFPNDQLYVTGKIGFVSERDLHKAVYYTYISRPNPDELLIVNEDGNLLQAEDTLDSAAVKVTAPGTEGDYPSFTGDGRSVVYEYFDGSEDLLKHYKLDVTPQTEEILNLPRNIRRPAGMKNKIVNFNAVYTNGNQIELTWDRYTENEVFYTVSYRKNLNDKYSEKKVYSQTGTALKGLTMGAEYEIRVSIIESDEEVASSRVVNLKVPLVAALPDHEIDPLNPYVVHLKAWMPEETVWNAGSSIVWNFEWLIENQPFAAKTSKDYLFEFASSGRKMIVLHVWDTDTHVYSEPMYVDIVSDIIPVIEYSISEDKRHLTLNAGNSRGSKIDKSSAVWVVSGPGQLPAPPVTGSSVIMDVSAYKEKVNVILKLARIPITGQASNDVLEVNKVIDLGYANVKPVITSMPDKVNANVLNFTGEHSIGNVDWLSARWQVFNDDQTIHQENGVSSFAYMFPENGKDKQYTVTLTVANSKGNGTVTASSLITLGATVVIPVINYEIVELTEGNNVVGSKVIFDATASKGSNIDFNSAKWSVPVAATYGEQPTQIGPTAIYNLFDVTEDVVVDVHLTLSRYGGGDPVTFVKSVPIKNDNNSDARIIVKKEVSNNSTGRIIYLNVLDSTGPNIDWEKTEWLLDGQYTRKGPAVRYDIPAKGEKDILSYQVTLYRFGSDPVIKRESIAIELDEIKPIIDVFTVTDKIPGAETVNNVIELSVANTQAPNIDWERTIWYIHDGNENVIQKYGATISHAFALKDGAMGYPVIVEMFFVGNTKPFVGYKTVDVEGDEFIPVIELHTETSEPNVITFTAGSSQGSNIDWSQAKWTFGDSSEAQYGPSSVHKYNVNSGDKKYTVSLTLMRKSVNGTVETKTVYKDVKIGSGQIQPIIKAKRVGYTIIFTAEDSTGTGLLLDRSIWLFDGDGDTETNSRSTSSSDTDTFSLQASVGIEVLIFTLGLSYTYTNSSTDSSSNVNTYSNQNTHMGIVCRRSISASTHAVTLTVYRIESDGTIRGETITKSVNIGALNEEFSEL